MRILVMGAGAIGSVVGGLMAEAGHSVTLVGRARHLNAIHGDGLQIRGIWGDHNVGGLSLLTDASDYAGDPPDLILITVKCYDTAAAVDAVRAIAGPNTVVCAYQNGLGNAELVGAAFGWDRTLAARAIYGARLTAPGNAEVTVIANPTAIGAWTPAGPAPRARAIAEAMDQAGLPTVFSDTIQTVLWSKVAYNCALNPLSALLDVPYGALAETEDTRAIMEDVVRELYAVGAALGVHLVPETPEEYLPLFYEKLLPPTAAHYASMREDFVRRRRTEIDALNGAIVRYGASLKIACPANRFLTRLVHAREHGYGVEVSTR